MIVEGQIVLFRFPQTDQNIGKLRPALVLRKLPGKYDDWLICMISSRISQQVHGFDEIVNEDDEDFGISGLKTASLIRISRLAVVDRNSSSARQETSARDVWLLSKTGFSIGCGVSSGFYAP